MEFADRLRGSLAQQGVADQIATQVLLTTAWPRKLAGWDEYLVDGGASGVRFAAIEAALDAAVPGPWDGASSGEYRSLRLACLVSSSGALTNALSGLDAETREAFLVGMNSSVGDSIRSIRAWEQRVLDAQNPDD